MIRINASKGLGDAIYLRAIVMQLLADDEQVTVYTQWPDVFFGLDITLRSLEEIGDHNGIRHAAYSRVAPIDGLNQYEMACHYAGLERAAPLDLRWKVRNEAKLARILSASKGRRIFIYQNVKKANNPEQELIRPKREAFRAFIDSFYDFFRIRTGHPDYVEDGDLPCELNLVGKTGIHDMFDLATIGDTFFSDPSYLPILAESLDKPHTIMFSRRGQQAESERVSRVTPELLFHKPALGIAIFDEDSSG